MKLLNDLFERIENGRKTIKIRLFDEKRRKFYKVHRYSVRYGKNTMCNDDWHNWDDWMYFTEEY